jgi:hypothetical protein
MLQASFAMIRRKLERLFDGNQPAPLRENRLADRRDATIA